MAARWTCIGIANNTGVKRAHGNWRDKARGDSGPKTLLKTLSWLGGREDAKNFDSIQGYFPDEPIRLPTNLPDTSDAFDWLDGRHGKREGVAGCSGETLLV